VSDDVVRELRWVGRSLEDLRDFPKEVKESFGYALHLAQVGKKHPDAKPLKGFGGAGVLECVEEFDGNAFRAVYTVKLAGWVFVLHAFQKKSHKGIRTTKHDVALIRERLALAEQEHAVLIAKEEEKKP
jgi:phage-related protein